MGEEDRTGFILKCYFKGFVGTKGGLVVYVQTMFIQSNSSRSISPFHETTSKISTRSPHIDAAIGSSGEDERGFAFLSIGNVVGD